MIPLTQREKGGYNYVTHLASKDTGRALPVDDTASLWRDDSRTLPAAKPVHPTVVHAGDSDFEIIPNNTISDSLVTAAESEG